MGVHRHNVFIHPTSDVSSQAAIGEGTKIWQHCQVRENAVIGRNCVLSKGVYVDAGVVVGNNVKIQNGISIYHGVTLEDGVFCGPHCVFTNDKEPRAINPDGSLKSLLILIGRLAIHWLKSALLYDAYGMMVYDLVIFRE